MLSGAVFFVCFLYFNVSPEAFFGGRGGERGVFSVNSESMFVVMPSM